MMNPTAIVIDILLLLTLILFYVNVASMELITNKSTIIMNNNSEIFMNNDNNMSSKQSMEMSTATVITAINVNINQNLSSTMKIPSAFEANDMVKSFFKPNDKIDDSIIPITSVMSVQSQNHSVTTAGSINHVNSTILNDLTMRNNEHDILPVKIFPDNPDKSITDLPLDVQRKFTHDTYIIGDMNINPVISMTIEPLNTSTVQESFLTIETREEIMKKKHLDMTVPLDDDNINGKKIPSGIIALISAISFATIAVIIYIGVIGWKRYQEHLHGHRELLVNDFDSNDINNFEL